MLELSEGKTSSGVPSKFGKSLWSQEGLRFLCGKDERLAPEKVENEDKGSSQMRMLPEANTDKFQWVSPHSKILRMRQIGREMLYVLSVPKVLQMPEWIEDILTGIITGMLILSAVVCL